MIPTINQPYDVPFMTDQRRGRESESADAFGSVFAEALQGQAAQTGPSIEEAARQMEIHITTLMFKVMDQSSSEGGLLGSKSEGMGHFKDLFFQTVAEELVDQKGLGFKEALANTYKT